MDKEIKKIAKPIGLLVLLLLFSSVLFFILARWEQRDVSYLQCLYMVTITISTIGYEDPLNTKDSVVLTVVNIFAILTYMVVVAYTVSNFTAFLVEGRLKKYFEYKKQQNRIRKMDQHYIICGIKDIGVFVAQELYETQRPFVVIEEDGQAIELLRKDIPTLVYLEGDATDDQVLVEAGIGRAKALVACLENDKENLYLVVAAQEWNKNLQLAAKYNFPKTRKKLVTAGANYLVSPYMIGGMRIVSELIRPLVVSFLDRMLRDKKETGIRVEEVKVPTDSPLVGRTLRQLYDQTGILVISYHEAGDHDFAYNPSPDRQITGGMGLIFIATPEKRLTFETMLNPIKR